MGTMAHPAIEEVTVIVFKLAAKLATGRLRVTVLPSLPLVKEAPIALPPKKAWYLTFFWVLVIDTVVVVASEHTMLPVTVSIPLGNGLTSTPAVSVMGTMVQPGIEEETLMLFNPLVKLATGRLRVTVLPLLGLTTGVPMAVAPT